MSKKNKESEKNKSGFKKRFLGALASLLLAKAVIDIITGAI